MLRFGASSPKKIGDGIKDDKKDNYITYQLCKEPNAAQKYTYQTDMSTEDMGEI